MSAGCHDFARCRRRRAQGSFLRRIGLQGLTAFVAKRTRTEGIPQCGADWIWLPCGTPTSPFDSEYVDEEVTIYNATQTERVSLCKRSNLDAMGATGWLSLGSLARDLAIDAGVDAVIGARPMDEYEVRGRSYADQHAKK